MPRLTVWAHGRLPARARGLMDTSDLVQSTLIQALKGLKTFEPRHEGAFLAFTRKILLNLIRDQIRRSGPVQESVTACEELPARQRSPLEEIIGRETLERYETAMARLPEEHRAAVFLRVELGMRYQEIAEALGMPSANAARMCVARALQRLAPALRDGHGPG